MQSALRDHFVSPSTTRVTDWAHIKRSLVQGDWKQRLKIKDNHATLLNDVTDLHLCTGNRKFKTRATAALMTEASTVGHLVQYVQKHGKAPKAAAPPRSGAKPRDPVMRATVVRPSAVQMEEELKQLTKEGE